ncbi:MAG: hypothetical protein IKE75_03460 [Bacilli bacterium]|nr:hypothetical protein [Bacilli bacterium]
MVDVDKRIMQYHEAKRAALSLRKEVEELSSLIENLEGLISFENEKSRLLGDEVIASIKVGDLLNKISSLLDVKVEDLVTNITVVGGTYEGDIKSLYGFRREDPSTLNSRLCILKTDGTILVSKDLRLFNDLNEMQADGYILLRHCTLKKGRFMRSDLVVSDNVNDIICNFRVDAVDYENYGDGLDRVLPMAIRECIKDDLVQEATTLKEKQLVRSN